VRNPFADCLLTEAGSLASADYMCLSAFHLSRSSVDCKRRGRHGNGFSFITLICRQLLKLIVASECQMV